MRYTDRSDAELLELAQAGWAPAFAVLLHRHGPAVRSAVREAPDPTAAVADVFVAAMRELPYLDLDTPPRAWLLELAGATGVPDPLVPLAEEERDAIWSLLAERWPHGHAPRRAKPGLRRAALVVALVGLSALVPTLVVLAGEGMEPADELSAHPVADDRVATETEDPEPLPSFTFPSAPEIEVPVTPPPPPQPQVERTIASPTTPPPSDPSPSPSPTAEPADPEPDEPDPTAEPTTDPEPTTEPTTPPPSQPPPEPPPPDDDQAEAP